MADLSDLKRILWLASYPKSGNTWLRIFLANYFSGYDYPIDINNMTQQGLHIQDTWLAAWGDPPPPAWMQPKYRYKALSQIAPIWAKRCGQDGLVFVKTHYARSKWKDREMIPMDLTAGGIYIVRNPVDVAISCASHFNTPVGNAARQMNDHGRTLEHRGIGQWLGTWSAHVKSWGDAYVIRYEDMLADPVGTFGGVLDYLHQDHCRLETAIGFSSLAELQKQERAEGFREDKTGNGFFDVEKKKISKGTIDKIRRDHGEMMERHGYA